MKKTIYLFLLLFISKGLYAQCDPEVPTYVIDLSNNADTTWVLYEADALDRDGQCCGVPNSENCIKFEITLHPNAAGIFFDYDGAGAFGSLNWREDCGTPHDLRDTICVTDLSFTLTFCKPGSDNGNYTLVSVPKPTFPNDQFVPMNCVQPVEAIGVEANTIQWESISPGAPGDYDGYLSCTDCLDPVFTPNPTGPSEIRYRVCGYPILDYCVGNFDFCDTVKFTVQDSLKLSISPLAPAFCSGGSVTLTASAIGGDGNYDYIWYNSSLQVVGSGATYSASIAGTYTCEVRDGNFEPGFCDDFFKTVVVVETSPPVINAGPDQVLCATSPNATLSGTYQYSSGVTWSGGAGTFQNGLTSATNTYIPTAGEIGIGSVTLTLSSSGVGGGCVNTNDQIQLFFVDTVETNLTNQMLLCNSGTISVNPTITTGGMAPFNYSWTNGINSAANTLGEGTFCLTITDGNSCQTTHCITISAPAQLNTVMSSTPATTNGGNDGTASVAVSGGTGSYTYLWSNGGTTASISGLSYGIYTVTVTDGNGCQHGGSVVVNEPRCNGFFVNTTSTNVACFSDSTGSATAVINPGTPPYTYVWNDPSNQTAAVATDLPAGVYTVTVTDGSGCFAISTAVVTEPTPLINTFLHTDVTVQGGNDGQASANVTGGTGALSYLWSSGSNTNTASLLTANTYYLTVTDGNGCVLQDSVQISEPPCNEFMAMINTVSPLCNGAATASASMTLLNGVGPYTILWSTGQTNTLSVNNITAGFHTVEITDFRGCEIFQTFGISQPSPLSIGFSPTPSTCSGDDNGTIDLSVSGGTYPYYYFNWSNGATTEDQIGLEPGSYSITVLDENGCQATSGVTLTEPAPLNVSYSSVNATCFGYSDASIDVNVTGGTTPYNYDWSNGEATQDLSGIDLGGYILVLTDANFCSPGTPLTVLIEEPSLVEAQSVTVACPAPGASTAAVTVAPIGGNANYSISYDGGSNFGPLGTYIENLVVDASYNVVVMDINGCLSASTPITIDTNVSITAATFNKCYIIGQTNESVTVSVIGGSPTYALSSDNGSNFGTQGVSVLSLAIDNSYQLVAMDDNGCLSVPYAVLLPDVFDETTAITTNFNGEDVSCFGSANGQALSTVSGGTLPYSYSWTNGQTTALATGLSAGTYTVSVLDGFGCSTSGSVTLSQPADLGQTIVAANYPSGDNISCNGENDGSINLTVTGGVEPYTYVWSNGNTVQDPSSLTAGVYSVIVTDFNGCTIPGSVTLLEPTLLAQSLDPNEFASGTNISCFGQNDGSIDQIVSGGSLPYTFNWSNGATTEDVSSLTAGNYSVTVTDKNGCNLTALANLLEPALLTQNISAFEYASGTNISCNGLSDGSIELIVNGGNTPYTYNWSNGSVLEDPTGLPTGTYSITVTDMNGCVVLASIILEEPTALTQALSAFTYPSGDNVSCFGYSDGSVDLIIGGGNTPYLYDWSNGAITEDLAGIPAGTYSVLVTDTNGCEINASVTLLEPAGMSHTITSFSYPSGSNISCYGENDGSVDLTITGGGSPYSYDWSNGATTQDLSGLTAGTYNVTVAEVNGCEITASITLNEPDTIIITGVTVDPACNGFNNGSIDATVIGGSLPYAYTWTTGATTQDISSLIAGSYDLSLVDENGCIAAQTFVLGQPAVLTLGLTSPLNFHEHNISLFGENDGVIDATVLGGTLQYTYDWSNGDSQEDLSGLTAGAYILTVTDAQGCFISDTIELTQPYELELPTIFTPNQDGENDVFDIHGIEAYPDNELTVVNRWGNVVYTEEHYHNTWTGIHSNGEELPDGVYFVILKINGGEIERNSYVHIKKH